MNLDCEYNVPSFSEPSSSETRWSQWCHYRQHPPRWSYPEARLLWDSVQEIAWPYPTPSSWCYLRECWSHENILRWESQIYTCPTKLRKGTYTRTIAILVKEAESLPEFGDLIVGKLIGHGGSSLALPWASTGEFKGFQASTEGRVTQQPNFSTSAGGWNACGCFSSRLSAGMRREGKPGCFLPRFHSPLPSA